ncbi:MAG: hypothetical protein EHM70_11225, partial [Chloroflexota bacterium]
AMIRVKVVAPFNLNEADKVGEIELPDRTTVAQLLRRLGAPLYAYALPVAVNSKQASRRQVLHDGDLVVFIVPISGG